MTPYPDPLRGLLGGREPLLNLRRAARAQVILLTDADVDGAHIRTLLLTFLFRYARALFEAGHVYVGVPPLYRLEAGRSSQYLYSEAELRTALAGRDPASVNIQRFKARPMRRAARPRGLLDCAGLGGRVSANLCCDDCACRLALQGGGHPACSVTVSMLTGAPEGLCQAAKCLRMCAST